MGISTIHYFGGGFIKILHPLKMMFGCTVHRNLTALKGRSDAWPYPPVCPSFVRLHFIDLT